MESVENPDNSRGFKNDFLLNPVEKEARKNFSLFFKFSLFHKFSKREKESGFSEKEKVGLKDLLFSKKQKKKEDETLPFYYNIFSIEIFSSRVISPTASQKRAFAV